MAQPPSVPVLVGQHGGCIPGRVAGFEVIWAGRLSTSQAPADDGQWRWLREQGVNTIVNLEAVMFDFAQYGFESFLWMPVGAGEPPTGEGAERFLKFIRLCDNQPAHISGDARDGRATMVALARYAIDGWTIEAALAEGQRLNGGAPLSPEQATWLLGWAAAHLPGSERPDGCSGLKAPAAILTDSSATARYSNQDPPDRNFRVPRIVPSERVA
jgi:hypothetical protein